jgi:Xaa-Pro dipeptidase
MSSAEIDVSQLLPQHMGNASAIEGEAFARSVWDGHIEGREPVDRVVETAADLPSPDSLPAMADPAADHEDATLSVRRADVEAKHQRIIAYLERTGYDAVLLGRADSLAWFTSGGDLGIDVTSEAGAAWIFVSRKCRTLFADNVQSARLFEEELAGLGFQLKERAWFDDPDRFVTDVSHSKRVASDLPRPGLLDESKALRALRYPLTGIERQRLRELGRTLTLAVESTCRNFHTGETEAHVAGHLAHRLLREGVTPVCIRVAGDDRLARFRQPKFKSAEIRDRATIAAVGRRFGLCAAVTRTVAFGKVDKQVHADHGLAAMVDATCIFFSRPGEAVAEVFRRAKRIYEKFDHPHEWTLDYQGAQIGYSPREMVFRPDCPATLTHGMAVCWSPSVGSARSEDTVVVDSRGFEVVTEAQNWPKIEVMVKGFAIPRPGILMR